MKTKNLFRTALFALFTVMMLGFISCNNDDDMPVAPVDPRSEKGHDEPAKITFTFHIGHLHGSTFHGNPFNEEVKYYKSVQEYSFEYDDKGNLVPTGEPIRLLRNNYYALEINYYDKDGELMNTEFGTPENAPIHQHFFMVKNATELKSDTPFANADNILTYTYRDTNPVDGAFKIDDGVSLRENDPIGLKGYFKVNEIYTKFDLNVVLVHITSGNKFKADGTTYPFNKPNGAFLSTQDLNVNIPMRVYSENADEETLYQEVADEFGVTKEEAEADVNLQWNTPFESGSFWM